MVEMDRLGIDNPPDDALIVDEVNRYSIARAVGVRARALVDGLFTDDQNQTQYTNATLSGMDGRNPVSVALLEFAAGTVKIAPFENEQLDETDSPRGEPAAA